MPTIANKHERDSRTQTHVHKNPCEFVCGKATTTNLVPQKKNRKKEIASLLILPTFTEPPEPLPA